jgi:hypothetical protein
MFPEFFTIQAGMHTRHHDETREAHVAQEALPHAGGFDNGDNLPRITSRLCAPL